MTIFKFDAVSRNGQLIKINILCNCITFVLLSILNFSQTRCRSLIEILSYCGCPCMYSWTLPSLLKGNARGVGPSKNWVTWRGSRTFCLKGGINQKRRGWCRNCGVATYSSVTFTVRVRKVRFLLLLFRSSVFSVSHARLSSKSLLY